MSVAIPALKIRIYPIREYILYLLFLWYVLYTGLAPLVPFYDLLDELVFVLMGGLAFLKLFSRQGKLCLRAEWFWLMGGVWIVVILSKLFNQSALSLFVKYTYLLSRPFFVLLYLASYRLAMERIWRNIVRISRVLILYNLPAIVFNLITYNVKILEAAYNDNIVGFFPFQNNDSLVFLYSIVLFKDFYHVFIQKQTKRWWLFALEYLLLLSTMNFKVTIVVTFTFGLIVFLRSRHKIRNTLLLMIVIIYPTIVLTPILLERFSGARRTAPVILAADMLVSGRVSEYNWLLGTGPGTFASPTAFESNSRLAHKYGLFEMKHYWEEVYTGATGTFTRMTSSALTLFGDIGVIGFSLYSLFLLLIVWCSYKNIRTSYVGLIGFGMGMYTLVLGLIMDIWFWGLEIFLVMLAAKYVSELMMQQNIEKK